MKIGVVADTHGNMHPRVFDLFAGVDHIFHAGDIGKAEIITELRSVAPVTAVYGNVDRFPLVTELPERVVMTVGSHTILMTHIFEERTARGIRRLLDAAHVKDLSAIIYGHTHEARIDVVGNVLLFNPGSAGPSRFQTKPSAGLLTIQPNQPPSVQILWL